MIDDGIGIPDDKRDKIFEPFQRAGQETGPIEGTGIGLAISKRLAELMQRQRRLRSEVGHGSEFWVELPVAPRPRGSAERSRERRRDRSPARDRRSAAHTIVYVEDNPSNIAFMRELLEELPSVELLTAPTAEIGIELVRARQPGGRDHGHQPARHERLRRGQAAARVARDARHPGDRAVGGGAGRATRARAKDAGFYRYLTKPVKVDELTETLERAARGSLNAPRRSDTPKCPRPGRRSPRGHRRAAEVVERARLAGHRVGAP